MFNYVYNLCNFSLLYLNRLFFSISHRTYSNKLFLDIHKVLIGKVSDLGWNKTIFNLNFIKNFHDNCEYIDYIVSRLKNELHQNYTDYLNHPWHWKCPTSALFQNTWIKIFPEAYYIINTRNPKRVAKSFLRRTGSTFLPFHKGIEFYRLMENNIFSVRKKNYVLINFDRIRNDIYKIAEFIPIDVSDSQIKDALERDNFMTPDSAKEFGLIDKVVEKRE